jgi:hypothetical protein
LGPVVPIPGAWWGDYIDMAGMNICGNNPTAPDGTITVQFRTEDLSKCADHGGTANWLKLTSEEETCENRTESGGTRKVRRNPNWRPGNDFQKYTTNSTPDSIDAYRMEDGTIINRPEGEPLEAENRFPPPASRWCKVEEETKTVDCFCEKDDCTTGCSDGEEEGTKEIIIYDKTEWMLVDCEYEEQKEMNAEFSGLTPSDSDKPKPYVLKDDWKDYMQFTGVARKKVKDKLKLIKRETNVKVRVGLKADTETNYVVARAIVYNPTSEDTFTQDWRVALAPCTLEGFNVGGGLKEVLGDESFGDKIPASIENAKTKIKTFLSAALEKVITH